MPRGHYDRHQARQHREAAQQESITIIERPPEPQLPDPLIFPPDDVIDGHPVHYDPVRVDLSLGAEPPTLVPIFDPEPEAADPVPPVRVLTPYSFYDDSGTLHSWAESQLVSDPSIIALLASRGVPVTEDVGDTNGLAVAARPRGPVIAAPVGSPLRLSAPYEYYDQYNVKRSWVIGEYVSDPATAQLLRERGASVIDAV